ncbi:Glutamate racemase [Escherichia coli]|nr:Glutamate racemase [Escherichia coli]
MATKLQDGNTPCLAATPSEPRPTVLVFDSGVGGLSVYDEIRHLLPYLHYIYAFDNVAFPYGEKGEEFIVERVVAIVTAVQERYPPCRWLWVACKHRQYRFTSCITRKVRLPGCWCRAGD